MRIKYSKPFSPDQLRALGLPADPTDTSKLDLIPTALLRGLVDSAYDQLDSEYPSADAADWYAALAGVLERRDEDETATLGHPA